MPDDDDPDGVTRWYDYKVDPLTAAKRQLHDLWWSPSAGGVKWVRRDAAERILDRLAARLRRSS